MAHSQNYYNMLDLENDYNIEFDTASDYVNLATRALQRKEREEREKKEKEQ